MVPDAHSTGTISVPLPDPQATDRLGARLSALAEPGDVIGLTGELGTGKTALSRAFVTALFDKFGYEREEVPSPTFTLVQLYEFPSFTVHHFDLYRLEKPNDVYELGFEDALAAGVSLIEWPDRIAPLLPIDRLDVVLLQGERENERQAVLTPCGGWPARLARGHIVG